MRNKTVQIKQTNQNFNPRKPTLNKNVKILKIAISKNNV